MSEEKYSYNQEVFKNDDYLVDSDGVVSFIGDSDFVSYVNLIELLAKELQTAEEENVKLKNYTESVENGNIILQQQNKQIKEALEKIIDRECDNTCAIITQQALKGVE